MIKVFTTNSAGKIEFTEKELEKVLNEAYDEGYQKGRQDKSNIYPSPYYSPNDVKIRPLESNDPDCSIAARKPTNDYYTNEAITKLHRELNLK